MPALPELFGATDTRERASAMSSTTGAVLRACQYTAAIALLGSITESGTKTYIPGSGGNGGVTPGCDTGLVGPSLQRLDL
jgi:hypothetical protein